MTLETYFHSIDINEIDRFISDKQEEHLNLEFKTVNHPEYNDKNKDDDRKNFSKTLSGFANSNGGIIIWGIKAQANSLGQDVARELRPIKQLTKFLNQLNRLEGLSVIPTVIGVIHEKIECGDDLGYIKTLVPKSEVAPHMAIYAGKYYYKRSGDSFYQCEHYDIIDMFSRKKSPKLKFVIKVISKEMIHQVKYRYRILVSIMNEGHNIAKYPYLALNFSTFFMPYEFGLDGNRNTGLSKVRNNVVFNHNYSGGIDKVIYPSAILDVDIFYIDLSKDATPDNLQIDYMISAEDADTIKGKYEVESKSFLDS